MRPLFGVVLVPSIPMNDDRLSTSGSFRITCASCLLPLRHRGERNRLRRLRNAQNHARILHREEALGTTMYRNSVSDQRRRPSPAA